MDVRVWRGTTLSCISFTVQGFNLFYTLSVPPLFYPVSCFQELLSYFIATLKSSPVKKSRQLATFEPVGRGKNVEGKHVGGVVSLLQNPENSHTSCRSKRGGKLTPLQKRQRLESSQGEIASSGVCLTCSSSSSLHIERQACLPN